MPLCSDTTLLTADGAFVPVTEVAKGMWLMDPDGHPVQVPWVESAFKAPVFKVTFDSGRTVNVSACHRLSCLHTGLRPGITARDLAVKRHNLDEYKLHNPLFAGIRDAEPENPEAYLYGFRIGRRQWTSNGRRYPARVPEDLANQWPRAFLSGLIDGGGRFLDSGRVHFNFTGIEDLKPAIANLVFRTGGRFNNHNMAWPDAFQFTRNLSNRAVDSCEFPYGTTCASIVKVTLIPESLKKPKLCYTIGLERFVVQDYIPMDTGSRRRSLPNKA